MLNQSALASRKNNMESSLKNMVISLFGITLICSASVAMIQGVTAEPIRKAQAAATANALAVVLPKFDKTSEQEFTIDKQKIVVYSATEGETLVGYAVKSSTKEGYGGYISMMVGISPENEVLGVSILSHNETPGLGSEMCEPDNSLIKSVQGKSLATLNLKVKKDGGDIDALSGATISSRAYGDAIERAYEAVKMVEKN